MSRRDSGRAAKTLRQGYRSAAKAGNWEQAAAELKNLSSTCAGCHAAHREKTQEGFIIK